MEEGRGKREEEGGKWAREKWAMGYGQAEKAKGTEAGPIICC